MDTNDLDGLDWLRLGVIALFAMPVAGMFSALIALDLTRSVELHVATAVVVPFAVVALIVRRAGVSSGLALRLSLLAALVAMVLLDLGWSGAPGA